MAQKLKDRFFTRSSIRQLADGIEGVYPAFDKGRFLALIYDEDWESRELKAKMRHTTRCLRATLPDSFPEALEILKKVAPQTRGFEVLTFPDYVEMYGLEDWEISIPALAYFTQYGSAEFAVRPFLDRDPKRAMGYLSSWAEHGNPDVRRLASEGCRPRLPWRMALPKFKEDPSLILPILEKLKDDESEAVRRSVANNLNDISKDHPQVVLDVCERWYGQSERTDSIVKHACRSLLKAGNRRALKLFGFSDPKQIRVEELTLEKDRLRIGEDLGFSFELCVGGEEEQKIRLEYSIHHVRARGRISRKVFQYSEKMYVPGEHWLQKTHSMADRSTRKHYPGEHLLAIIVNGEEKAKASFRLIEEDEQGD